VDEVVVEREHTPVAVEANLDLVHLSPFLVDRGEMLLAVFGPFDGPAQLHRRERDQQLVRVEEHDLRPEAPAHVRGDHVNVRLRKTEEHSETAADRGRRLGGVVDREPVLGLGPSRPYRAALHRARGPALEAQTQVLAMGRGGKRGLHVSRLLQQLRCDVAGDVVVDEVLGGRGHLRCDHDGHRLVRPWVRLGCGMRMGRSVWPNGKSSAT